MNHHAAPPATAAAPTPRSTFVVVLMGAAVRVSPTPPAFFGGPKAGPKVIGFRWTGAHVYVPGVCTVPGGQLIFMTIGSRRGIDAGKV
jgi:hypothetical protein